MKKLLPAVLGLLLALGASAQTGHPASAKAKRPAAQPAQPQTTQPSASDQAEMDDLKADLERMKVTLNQMQTNLGFVSSTTQPLRHQFELEIDMWQIEIGRMERKLQRLEAKAKP